MACVLLTATVATNFVEQAGIAPLCGPCMHKAFKAMAHVLTWLWGNSAA